MKIRLRKQSEFHRHLERVFRLHGHALKLPSVGRLKAELSVERFIAWSLGSEPETIRGEPRWTCPFHPDSNPSLWARDDHRSGTPRWGCNPCGLSGDVVDWVMKYHRLSWSAAIALLQVRLKHRYEEFRR